ncbi:hypothetical protein RIF29_40436 [Crotalaria pallida]|uniref:Uncharacterized protein n=1 Tax=Crotalaria pallida TaxID=3830 RepID=A0AAN9E3I3_CROPI
MLTVMPCCQVLLELAQNRNKIPLPKSIAGPGVPLPPDQDTLISPNYQLVIPNKRPAEPMEETEDEEAANTKLPTPHGKTRWICKCNRIQFSGSSLPELFRFTATGISFPVSHNRRCNQNPIFGSAKPK